jgi:hypothetical protein
MNGTIQASEVIAMCNFFSFVSNGKGKYFYFDWSQRTDKLIKVDSFDSHSEICAHYDIDCDKVNKYEYNPLIKNFKTDQINLKKDDSEYAKIWVEKLDFKTIVKPLVIKQIINPFTNRRKLKVTKKDIDLLTEWASVRDSVWASVWASVRDSVWASVWAYISSFFTIQYKYDFSSCVKLWESGLVPSFDGKIWRLHGYKGRVLYEMESKRGGKIG